MAHNYCNCGAPIDDYGACSDCRSKYNMEQYQQFVKLQYEVKRLRHLLVRVHIALAGKKYDPVVFDDLARKCKEAAGGIR